MHTYILIYINTHTYTLSIHAHTDTHIHSHSFKYAIRECMHTYTHQHARIHKDTHIRIKTHTHTHRHIHLSCIHIRTHGLISFPKYSRAYMHTCTKDTLDHYVHKNYSKRMHMLNIIIFNTCKHTMPSFLQTHTHTHTHPIVQFFSPNECVPVLSSKIHDQCLCVSESKRIYRFGFLRSKI
jgi:hypothetical protein